MAKPKILIQLDSDPHASVFDAVTAIDSNIDQLLQYHAVEPTQAQDLIYGAMFTRGPHDLHRTAIFIGGSNLTFGEALLQMAKDSFFGPMRVSLMLDANGANTTAAAAVLAAAEHANLAEARALVLGGTGPVGSRAARLLASEGATVRLGSRSKSRAAVTCETIEEKIENAKVTPVAAGSSQEIAAALEGVQVLVAAGAPGVQLVSKQLLQQSDLQVAIDLNAVPPSGIEAVETTARGDDLGGVACYGAIGVGGSKMKIHKAAIRQLFESNDQVLDAEEILAIGRKVLG